MSQSGGSGLVGERAMSEVVDLGQVMGEEAEATCFSVSQACGK